MQGHLKINSLGNMAKLDPNTWNHVKGHKESNPESSASHFTSNEAILKCQGPLRIKLNLF